MKLKFRVKLKDFIIFVGFSLFLLLLVSFAVGNLLILLRQDGEFTFNPFRGLYFDDILFTFFIFLSIEVAIFFSVDSKIFEGDSGFGLSQYFPLWHP